LARVLVTGGAGFIGSHLVDALLAEGETVRVLDDLSTGSLENLEGATASGRIEFIRGSVTDLRLTEDVAVGCERIFHLAATVGVRRVLADPLAGLRNNILGTDAVLRAARRGSPTSLVLFSSSEIYGRTTGGPLSEDDVSIIGPTAVPRWSYAASKVVGEYLALGEHQRNGMPVAIVRCFNTCGPRQTASYGMVIPSLMGQAMAGEPLTVYGDGTQTRCFSYVGDVVRGVLALSRLEAAGGRVFNIGSDEEISILGLAQKISAVWGGDRNVEMISYENAYGPGFEDVIRRVPDLSRIRALIGYRPETSLDRLLAITRDWFSSRIGQGRGEAVA
jgi:UDP-glucose 4-epimerase